MASGQGFLVTAARQSQVNRNRIQMRGEPGLLFMLVRPKGSLLLFSAYLAYLAART